MGQEDLEHDIVNLKRQVRLLTEENEALTERSEDIYLLGGISERIGRKDTLEEIAAIAVETIVTLKDIAYCACFSFEDDSPRVIEDYSVDLGSSWKGRTFAPEMELKNLIKEDKRFAELTDTDPLPEFIPGNLRGSPLNSYYIIPIIILQEVIGAIVCVNSLGNSQYLKDIVPLLDRVEGIIKARLETVTLLAKIKKKSETIEEQREEVAVANEELQAINDDLLEAQDELNILNTELESKVEERTAEISLTMESLIKEIEVREKAEMDMMESEEHLETILDSIHTGIMVVDVKTHMIVNINSYAAEMVGLTEEEIEGKLCHEFVCPAAVGKCPITDLHETVDNSERILIKADGEKIPILKSAVPINYKGQDWLVESFIDITKLKKLEHENLDAKDKIIEEMERHRDYVFEVADRLRNPMQALKGSLEIINTKDLSPEDRKIFIENIHKSADDIEKWIKKLT